MRLFTFGCSFTQYKWPTWADILSKEFSFYENWGRPGAGNVYIANTVAQSSILNKINKDDTVIIMWTNMMREDRYITDWVCQGNIYTQSVYDEDFIKKYVTVKGCYIRDMAQIYFVEQLLEKIGCKYHFLSMVDVSNPVQYSNQSADDIDEVLTLYKNTIDKFKSSMHKTIFNYVWNSRLRHKSDIHPVPLLHLEYLDKILPEFEIKDETREWVKKITGNILTETSFEWDSHLPKEKL